MAITNIGANPVATPNPSAPTAVAASPYSNPTVAPNMLGIGNALGQQVFGGPSQSRSYTNQTTNRTPYSPVVGPINQYVAGTQQLYGGGAPQVSAPEQAGYNLLTSAEGGPAATALNTAAGTVGNIAGGSLMNIESNPYLASIMKTTGSQALQDVNSTFGGAGRTGSGLNQWDAAQGVATAENQLGASEYNTNVGATLSAAGQTPGLVSGSTVLPEEQIAAGTAQTMRPFQLNQTYGNILAQIAQLGGSTSTQQQSEATGLQANPGILGNTVSNLIGSLGQ